MTDLGDELARHYNHIGHPTQTGDGYYDYDNFVPATGKDAATMVFTASDGERSIRLLTFDEIAEQVVESQWLADYIKNQPMHNPPKGWYCTRDPYHTGPCAALPKWWNIKWKLWYCFG